MLKADQRPLDVENVVADHIWFAVLDQEFEVIHGLLDVLLMQHVADQTEIDVSWKKDEMKDENTNSYSPFINYFCVFSHLVPNFDLLIEIVPFSSNHFFF